jgi:peroxiredoxin Q/BCP
MLRAMNRLLRTALAILSIPFAASAADLAVGDAAPAFSLPGSDGKMHALADHAGKRAVVLAWFPKAFTPG